jgi:hypothetical protein
MTPAEGGIGGRGGLEVGKDQLFLVTKRFAQFQANTEVPSSVFPSTGGHARRGGLGIEGSFRA